LYPSGPQGSPDGSPASVDRSQSDRKKLRKAKGVHLHNEIEPSVFVRTNEKTIRKPFLGFLALPKAFAPASPKHNNTYSRYARFLLNEVAVI
jgi:hypothetical protein